jgi:DNA polymerase gamma 1
MTSMDEAPQNKEKAAQRHEQTTVAIQSVVEQLCDAEASLGDSEVDLVKRKELRKMRIEMEESLPQLHADALLVPARQTVGGFDVRQLA